MPVWGRAREAIWRISKGYRTASGEYYPEQSITIYQNNKCDWILIQILEQTDFLGAATQRSSGDHRQQHAGCRLPPYRGRRPRDSSRMKTTTIAIQSDPVIGRYHWLGRIYKRTTVMFGKLEKRKLQNENVAFRFFLPFDFHFGSFRCLPRCYSSLFSVEHRRRTGNHGRRIRQDPS